MKWSVGTKIGAGYALALAILLILGVVSYRNTTGLIEAAQMKAHTYFYFVRLIFNNLRLSFYMVMI